MAIAKVKKIEIIGLNKDKGRLLGVLQKLEIVQLLDIQHEAVRVDKEIIPQEINLLQMQEAISYLSSFKKEKPNILESLTNLKPVVYQRQLRNIIDEFDFKKPLKDLADLRYNIKELTQQRERLIQKRNIFTPWHNLDIPLEGLYPTDYCGIFLGVLNRRDYPSLLKDAAKENMGFFYEIITEDKTDIYLSIIYLKRDFKRLEPLLKNYRFNFVTLGHGQGAIKDNLLDINAGISTLDDQILKIKDKITQVAAEQFKLMIVYDYLANIDNINEAEENLVKQQYTFILKGWIKQKNILSLEKQLIENFKEIEIFISQPEEGEDIPVILENKRLIEPFEFITQIYGMPKYNELDPTPYLAPFFFLYFGFCVSDVGYGIILSLMSYLVLKRFKLGAQGQRFWRMFLYCGISTIVIGAITGSWFGNLFDMLAEHNKIFLPVKNFKDSLVLLDPIKEPTKLLAIALCFGITQVWFGNIVAAIGNIKNRRYLDVILDQVPMLLFLFGLTGSGLIFLKLLSGAHMALFRNALILSATALVLTQGRCEKGLGSKLFYGAYNLYSAVSGYLSDILSYSRLWALGLVTGVMASTINLISVQFSQIIVSLIPFIDKIMPLKILISTFILITIFVFGHFASFLMNLLGAFVHPLRLQFVEFFSKFFKGGGSSFRPFKVQTRYVKIG